MKGKWFEHAAKLVQESKMKRVPAVPLCEPGIKMLKIILRNSPPLRRLDHLPRKPWDHLIARLTVREAGPNEVSENNPKSSC